MKRWLIIADPVAVLHPGSDSTLTLVQRALLRKVKCDWATAEDLQLSEETLQVSAREVEPFSLGELPKLGSPRVLPIRKYSTVWIRKDPPFDQSYLKLCWLLALEEGNVEMINRPSVLLRFHEKMLPWEAYRHGYIPRAALVPTYLGPASALRDWLDKYPAEQWVQKPFLGHGGRGVHKVEKAQALAEEQKEPMLWQPFLPEVQSEGDCRLIYFRGVLLGFFFRRPRAGHFVANLAQGGTAYWQRLSKRQEELAKKISGFLKKTKIDFAGVDFIGSRLTEINTTSPTGLRTVWELVGADVADKMVCAVLGIKPKK